MAPRKKKEPEIVDDTLFGGPVTPEPEYVTKTAKEPFKAITAISETRPLRVDDVLHHYDPFLTNRAFSLDQETVMLAAHMNERWWISKEMQIAFYLNTVRPRRRWSKWPKALTDERIDIIARYYGMSQREARIHSPLITDEQIEQMRTVLGEGEDVRLQRR